MSATASIGFTLTGPAPATATIQITYNGQSSADRIEMTGAMTHTIDLAMMPAAGLKGLLVRLDPLDASGAAVTAPVTVTWTSNAVAKSQELSTGDSGGFIAICSPSPTNGITALSITSTADCVVRVAALG